MRTPRENDRRTRATVRRRTKVGNGRMFTIRSRCELAASRRILLCFQRKRSGGCTGIRTQDRLIKSQLLYQLSYTPTSRFGQRRFQFRPWPVSKHPRGGERDAPAVVSGYIQRRSRACKGFSHGVRPTMVFALSPGDIFEGRNREGGGDMPASFRSLQDSASLAGPARNFLTLRLTVDRPPSRLRGDPIMRCRRLGRAHACRVPQDPLQKGACGNEEDRTDGTEVTKSIGLILVCGARAAGTR